MNKKIVLMITMTFISLSASALETDQYMTWGVELSDSGGYINKYLNEKISSALKVIDSELTCEKAAIESMDWNGRTTDMLSAIESDMYHSEEVDRWPPLTKSAKGVIKESIYRDVSIFKLKVFGVNLKMNGVYFGVDKLGHFVTVGRDYYKTFRKYRRRGKSIEFSQIKAIKRGLFSERTYYGYLVSGVFSFADLEANFQGLEFMRSMCEGDKPLLKKDNEGNWSLSRKIDITNYVTPKWDESFYTSTYRKKRFRQVRPHLAKYCEKRSEPSVIKRFTSYYLRDKDNLNSTYLDNLVSKKKLKVPAFQNLSFVCAMIEQGINIK
jgi:hypothetical protein